MISGRQFDTNDKRAFGVSSQTLYRDGDLICIWTIVSCGRCCWCGRRLDPLAAASLLFIFKSMTRMA
jgi:hypothetical protein